jgi:hypothetical protein
LNPVVETGRIAAGGVGQHGLDLVEALGENGFRRLCRRILVPQRDHLGLQIVGQGSAQLYQIRPFPQSAVIAGTLVGCRHISGDRLTEIVDDADLDQPEKVDPFEGIAKQDGQKAQPPAVFGGAFLPPLRRVAAAQRVLELVGRVKKCEDCRNPARVGRHGASAAVCIGVRGAGQRAS